MNNLKNLHVAFGLLFVVAGAISAQDPPLKPVPELEILNRLDADQDGFLQISEIPPPVADFAKSLIKTCQAENAFDAKTGRINLELLDSIVREYLSKPQTPEKKKRRISNRESLLYAANLIAIYDKDDDQRLGSSEFKQLSDKWIECDLNLDLQLDLIEVASGLKYALEFPRNPDGTFDQGVADSDRVTLTKIHESIVAELEGQKETPPIKKPAGNPRQYATALVANYDKNRNGSLDSTELKQIGPAWLEADFDKDGKATVDEIQVRFQYFEEQATQEAGASEAEASVPPASQIGESDLKPAPRSPQSAQPDPSTIPVSSEFKKLDANSDGQIQMHEFANEFDASVVSDFYNRDASGDGVITLSEWNRFLAKRNQQQNDSQTNPDGNGKR